MRVTLCETFRRQAFWTWEALRQARRASCRIGEESLTDFNLLRIRTRHSQEVFTHTFTKPAEATTGADWEWWLTGPSRKWLGFRIQAKVIDLGTDTFKHLHYKSKTTRQFQSDVLIRNARVSQPTMIPAYCLYIHADNWRSLMSAVACRYYPATARSLGCALVDAHDIQRLRQSSATNTALAQVITSATPWHCLVCCSGYASGDLPVRARGYWKATRAAVLAGEDNLPELADAPPRYVAELIEGRGLIEHPPDEDVRRVTVFREQ
jgi:hypothetical protein